MSKFVLIVTVREVSFSSVSVVPGGSVVVSSLTVIFSPTSSSGVPGNGIEYRPSASEVPLATSSPSISTLMVTSGTGLGGSLRVSTRVPVTSRTSSPGSACAGELAPSNEMKTSSGRSATSRSRTQYS